MLASTAIGLLGLVAGPTAAAPAAPLPTDAVAGPVRSALAPRAVETTGDPLAMTIERLSPSTVPERGRVTVTGRITNRSGQTWSDLSVFLLTSTVPLVTRDDVAGAASADPLTQFGERLISPGLYVDVPDLAPGESTAYTLRVPREALAVSGAPGVYQLGVQVLGTDESGNRLEGAEGRARTFWPAVPRGTGSTELALGLQLRNHTVRAPDGSLEFLPGWQQTLSSGGRLGRLLDLSVSAGAFPVSWVVDPAVVEAADSVARDNPPLTLGPAEEVDELSEEAAKARAWLETYDQEAARRDTHVVPYGDLDVAAAARVDEEVLVARALGLSAGADGERAQTSRPVVAPLDGSLPAAAFATLDPSVAVFLRRDLVTQGISVVRAREDGGRVLLIDPVPTAEGSAARSTRTALQVRQRILAESALHALSAEAATPLVMVLPARWDPGPRWRRAEFFAGLDVPWLAPTTFTSVLLRPPADPVIDPAADVTYTDRQEAAELPSFVAAFVRVLLGRAADLDELLVDSDTVESRLARQALLSASYFSRVRPGLAAERARDAGDLVDAWLDQISVRSPGLVTLSSDTGTFNVSLVNGLDEPVVVGLDAAVSGDQGDLVLSVPEPVRLGPRQRTAMSVEVSSGELGIHRVVLSPVTSSGEKVGRATAVNVRSSRVGFVLWIIMGAGASVLFGAIAVRLVRRIRRRGSAYGPPEAPA